MASETTTVEAPTTTAVQLLPAAPVAPSLREQLPVTVAQAAVAAPPPEAATAGAGGAAEAAADHSATDVDVLVRRLYDPLVRRLKSELRLERERAGHVLDLRQ